jgi:hypothetical protein
MMRVQRPNNVDNRTLERVLSFPWGKGNSFHGLEPTFAHRICHYGRHPGAEMSRYFFDVKNGHRLVDPSGLDCRNDQEAIENAILIARQIARDAPPNGPRHVSVLNSDREEVSKVPINKEEKEDRSGEL